MRLEIGDCLARKGDLEGAITTYRDVIQLKQKAEFTAKAYYALGNIYQERRRDYNRALENFAQVKKESSRVVFADSAEIKARDILRMQALQNVIDQALRGGKGELEEVIAQRDTTEQDTVDVFGKKVYTFSDSLIADSLVYVERIKNDPAINNKYNEDKLIATSAPDDTSDTSVNGPKYRGMLRKMGIINWRDVKNFEVSDSDFAKKLEIGRRERMRKKKLAALAENPELKSFKKEELDKNLFLLAELYLFRFSIPDSALNQYRMLVQRFPQSPYTLQSLYNMHHIHRNINKGAISADSTLRRILAEYPNSEYAKSLRKEIGLQSASTEEDTLRALFAEAERLLFDQKNPVGAIEKYKALYEKYPETEYAAKAFYATAWAYENGLDSLHLAYVLYDSLLRRYPASPFTQKAKKKVDAVKEDQKKVKSGAGAESTAPVPASAAADSSAKNAADSLRNPASPAAGAESDSARSAVRPAAGARPAAPGGVPPPEQKPLRPTGEKSLQNPDTVKEGASRALPRQTGTGDAAKPVAPPSSPPSKTDRQ
jgi:outer membrane protein assembly factor BamD (BamD/ComL family)